MKNIIFELIKETFQVILLFWVIGIVGKLFFKHTLIGKIIAVVVMDTYMFIKFGLRIMNKTGKFTYKQAKSFNKYLVKKLEEKKEESNEKQTQKQVVNGVNVIDFTNYKNKKRM